MTANPDGITTVSLHSFLSRHRRNKVEVSELKQVVFPESLSQIIRSNNFAVYCCVFQGLEGLFRKDQPATRIYGRAVCDAVKLAFSCNGFFTSDELPRYGITAREIDHLYKTMNKERGDGQLIVILAYDYSTALNIQNYLASRFQSELASNLPAAKNDE